MPVIWLIDAYRAGERGQVRALVDALGWPCETKVLSYRKQCSAACTGRCPAAWHYRRIGRQLQPPWPDLVISCGVRNEPVCRWIRAQSGGRTRYVHVGRPWAALETFDLVITTPQYRVPRRPMSSTICSPCTVSRRSAWRRRGRVGRRFRDLPRPAFRGYRRWRQRAVHLGPKAAARLARQASRWPGSTVARCWCLPVRAPARRQCSAAGGDRCPNYFYRWRPDDTANPYFGMLAWADRLVVTGDSIAMLSEACATGKPVQMFDLGGMRGTSRAVDFRLGPRCMLADALVAGSP